MSDLQAKRIALTDVVSEHNATHNQQIAAVESVVNNNKAASESAVGEACSVLWLDGARKFWQLNEDINQQKVDIDSEITKLREEHLKGH